MKKEIERLIDKYEEKVNYRKYRLGEEKEKLARVLEKYDKEECSFETLERQQRSEAIQQDLLIEVAGILEDLKEVAKEGK